MSTKSELSMNNTSIAGNIVSWLFGIAVIAIGLINMFWGNDAGYGIFIFLLAFAYFPPVTAFFKKISGISIPLMVKIILGVFIIWSAIGVGELFDKIGLMMRDM
jgi:glucan phosphoethanolaminetransferase (alkaline phosphatase superfamily)